MTRDLMRYDLMTQDAMRAVVRRSLERVLESGLPGEHHFFITFATGASGVSISDALTGRYPEEMTIVLQHQFWGLEVDEDGFCVSLTFNKIPERLEIPFSAIKGFYDPSVQFGLQFQVEGSAEVYKPVDFDPSAKPEEQPVPEAKEEPEVIEETEEEEEDERGEVVNLDAFRKK